MNHKNAKIPLLAFVLLFSTFALIHPVIGSPLITSRTYTLDADFDEGVLVGVEHDTTHDQLQLSEEHVVPPYIWIPNNEGTVSKIHTETGNELGRYWVAPNPAREPFYGQHENYPDYPAWIPPAHCSPSRTTVDLQHNCWVGCRDAGTVVKIGLYETGHYVDRNEDGIIQTSRDLNGDGNIQNYIDPITLEKKIELLPWGEDECVLLEVVLYEYYVNGDDIRGPYVPGSFLGLWAVFPAD